MVQDIVFRLIAHISLVVYIAILVWLLYYLRKMVRNQTTKYIYATLYFWLILAVKDIVYFFGNIWYDAQVTNILMSIDLWPTPIMTILLLYALQPNWLNLWKIGSIMTPFFLFTLLNIVFKGDALIFLINQIYGFVFVTIFGIIIFILTFKCDIYVNANYSNKQLIDIRWVRYLIVLTYAISVLWLFTQIEPTWLGDTMYYILITILSSTLFYFALNHRKIVFPNYMTFDAILRDANSESIDPHSNVNERQFAEIEAKLEAAIKQDKVYLNPQLSLVDLANHIGTNRTYLSRYINNYRGTPFINYINDLRCEEAQRILSDKDNSLTMLELSERSGFASYSTFRRVFKQKYGCSPSSLR